MTSWDNLYMNKKPSNPPKKNGPKIGVPLKDSLGTLGTRFGTLDRGQATDASRRSGIDGSLPR